MADEWGPWTEHDGKGCPCVGQWVQAAFNVCTKPCSHGVLLNEIWEGRATGRTCWVWGEGYDEIIRYRIRRPRALLDLIERARELDDAPEGPVRVKPMVKEDAQ